LDKYTGKRLDARYEIHELIGVGGMALVYKAYDIIEEINVAVKILKDEFINNSEFTRRFRNESKAVAVLSHSNIVKVFDVSFGTKIQYIVMEYISGLTLKEYINKFLQNSNSNDAIHWKEALVLIKQILSALSHAHSKGIIHRDIKPQNIMVLEDGTVKVTDFGIARFFKNETQTITDRTIGSVHYISPEQAKGAKTDEKSDIYSIGVILYEMIAGKLPFDAENAVSVAIMQMQMSPEKPSSVVSFIPEGIEEIILKAMQKKPSDRFLSADEMLCDIEKFEKDNNLKFNYTFLAGNDQTTVIDVYNDRDDTDQKRGRAVLAVSGIAVVVVLFALAFMFMTMFTSYGGSARDVDVPNFVGIKISDIQDNYKFNWKIEPVYDSSKPEGIILGQEPEPGSKKIKSNAQILLKVNSSGILATVPQITGLSEEIAKSRLLNAGLKSETLMIADDTVPAGRVKYSDPPEGSKTATESTVRLYVSKGAETPTAQVPDILGMSLNEAKQEIINKGFKFSTDVTYENSDKPKDTILTSDPLPGVTINLGSLVKVTASSGIKKDKIIEIPVDLPLIASDITLKVYIDGTLDSSKTVTVDPSSSDKKVFSFSGKQGKKEIRIKIDNYLYRAYEIDFDANTSENCKIIVMNPYPAQ
jgi:serine/threonine-protein kinase